jgi:hypothetical protein
VLGECQLIFFLSSQPDLAADLAGWGDRCVIGDTTRGILFFAATPPGWTTAVVEDLLAAAKNKMR